MSDFNGDFSTSEIWREDKGREDADGLRGNPDLPQLRSILKGAAGCSHRCTSSFNLASSTDSLKGNESTEQGHVSFDIAASSVRQVNHGFDQREQRQRKAMLSISPDPGIMGPDMPLMSQVAPHDDEGYFDLSPSPIDAVKESLFKLQDELFKNSRNELEKLQASS